MAEIDSDYMLRQVVGVPGAPKPNYDEMMLKAVEARLQGYSDDFGVRIFGKEEWERMKKHDYAPSIPNIPINLSERKGLVMCLDLT